MITGDIYILSEIRQHVSQSVLQQTYKSALIPWRNKR